MEVISQILKVANGCNATKTRIRYKALLGYNPLKEHPVLLTEMDLLRYGGNTGTFNTTIRVYSFFKSTMRKRI